MFDCRINYLLTPAHIGFKITVRWCKSFSNRVPLISISGTAFSVNISSSVGLVCKCFIPSKLILGFNLSTNDALLACRVVVCLILYCLFAVCICLFYSVLFVCVIAVNNVADVCRLEYVLACIA